MLSVHLFITLRQALGYDYGFSRLIEWYCLANHVIYCGFQMSMFAPMVWKLIFSWSGESHRKTATDHEDVVSSIYWHSIQCWTWVPASPGLWSWSHKHARQIEIPDYGVVDISDVPSILWRNRICFPMLIMLDYLLMVLSILSGTVADI